MRHSFFAGPLINYNEYVNVTAVTAVTAVIVVTTVTAVAARLRKK